MVQMMAVHLDRPECDAGYSGTLLSKDEESEPKELRMPQNINALLLCFAEQDNARILAHFRIPALT